MPVVTAVGLAAPKRTAHAAKIEAAMLAALKKAQADGETNPRLLKAAMLAARARIKRQLEG